MLRIIILCLISACGLALAQTPPQIEWQRCYGGTDDDTGYSIGVTTDGGYIIAGCAGSVNGDILPKTSDALHGGKCDYWAARTDNKGNIVFKKLLDGTESDVARKAIQTDDGGYLIAGSTSSNDLDVSGNHGDFDVWIIKLDAAGEVVWKKCYGGPGYEDFGSLILTADGGFAFCAGTSSNSADVSGNHGSSDFWVVKANGSGAIQWARCYGGTGYEKAFSLCTMPDGGFVVCGFTDSQNGQVQGNHSFDLDGWVIRLDASGNLMWAKCFGGTLQETLYSVNTLMDGSLLLGGYATSADGDLTVNYGNDDGWLLRITDSGQLIWSQSFGGNSYDSFSKVLQEPGGLLLAAGYSRSASGHLTANYGDWDYWLMQIDLNGTVLFSQNYGGSGPDVCFDAALTGDGGLVMIGYSATTDTSNDVSGNRGKKDYWLAKLAGFTGMTAPDPLAGPLKIFPNPARDFVTITVPENVGQGVTVCLKDLSGRTVWREQVWSHSKTIRLLNLTAGCYSVEAETFQGVIAGLLMIQ